MKCNRIIDIRENAELNQTEMAEILLTTQSNYSRWETGTEFIPLSKLNLLCNYFHVNMDYVMNLSFQKKETNKITLDKKFIGKNIKTIRKKLHLTQKDVSTNLNTSQSTISAYESGKTIIITAFAYQICKTYNVSLDWLCGRSNDIFIK